MWSIYDTGKPSLLAKIYGIYEVQIEKDKMYFIAMENLFFGVDNNAKKRVYDLKGSELNRYVKPTKSVLLDTNYKLDQNGEPLPIGTDIKRWINEAIQNDTSFLAEKHVVDYSMLLIINEDDNSVKMGIIDYSVLYNMARALERGGKKLIRGATPTMTNPKEYRERFIRSMNKYLMGVHME
jgi:1-phosphatidylinositol-3-phosphate 5-kinase